MSALTFLPVILNIFIIIIFIIVCIVLPLSVYSAQKWAYKSYKELILIRAILQQIKSTTKP